MSNEKGPTIFDTMNAIFYKKKDFVYDSKVASPYMLTWWLSHDDNLLLMCVDKLNENMYNIPSEMVYEYYYSKVPKGRRFIKWVKKTEEKTKVDVEPLMEEYGLSKTEASMYRRILAK